MKRFFLIVSIAFCTEIVWADVCEPSLSEALAEFSFQPYWPQGVLNGNAVFSVSDDVQVYFSQGNLQYRASNGIAYSSDCADCLKHEVNDGDDNVVTYAQGEWRFAEHQYDFIGMDNSNASETYDGWIDLFGYGTSGWSGSCVAYQPWNPQGATASNTKYPQKNINATNSDWGIYNAISNGGDEPNLWRTLTSAEFNYLLTSRPNATSKRTLATVNNVKGLLILPDIWTSDLSFEATTTDFTTVTITKQNWSQWEANGAVFLPAAGARHGMEGMKNSSGGTYWSSTTAGATSYNLYFIAGTVTPQNSATTLYAYQDNACSVRLVMNK